MTTVQYGRIYDAPQPEGGARVLVDRLWPRGVAKDRAALDSWCRAIAPSDALRQWFGHDEAKFDEFAARYRVELDDPERAEAVGDLRVRADAGPLLLLTATKAVEISHAAVLVDLLNEEPS